MKFLVRGHIMSCCSFHHEKSQGFKKILNNLKRKHSKTDVTAQLGLHRQIHKSPKMQT